MMQRTRFFVVTLLGFLVLSSCNLDHVPPHVYLTWRQPDTARTITVNYHSSPELDGVEVRFDTVSRANRGDGDGGGYARKATGDHRTIQLVKRRVHAIDLTGLEPNTTYYFVVTDGKTELTPEKSFRTLPADDREISFVAGGDTYVNEALPRLHDQAAKLDPMFGMVGGDIAYDNGILTNYDLYDRWLEHWTTRMVASDGRLIPMVLAIGNHEVFGGYGGTPERAPFFINYFAQDMKRTYFRRHFGTHTAIYFLDSGHIADHGGAQARWLKETMAEDQELANRFAIYHVPLYPSVRPWDDKHSKAGRRHWLPIFDEMNLTASFENHDHAMKRTHPLKGGKVVAAGEGTIYVGDGCWGKGPRDTDNSRWYLDNASGTKHFWHVTASPSEVRMQAIDEQGAVRDSVTIQRNKSRRLAAR